MMMCCPDGLVWSQDELTCVFDDCVDGFNMTDCPEITDPRK